MKRPRNKRERLILERAKRGADGMAASTFGRARTYKDRRKEASRKACRGKVKV